MTSMKDRERAFEAKYAHDAEMQFKAEARANRALALWAAGLMGRDAAAAEAYVREVIRADFIEAGSEDVVRQGRRRHGRAGRRGQGAQQAGRMPDRGQGRALADRLTDVTARRAGRFGPASRASVA